MNEKLDNVHPGEVLEEEFLKPLGISQYLLAQKTGIDKMTVNEIVNGKRSITPETALLLSKFWGNSASFWLGLQNSYDLEEAQNKQVFRAKFANVTPFEYPTAA